MSQLTGVSRPYVAGELPGPLSAELLARQEQRESNARTYPRMGQPVAIVIYDKKLDVWTPGAHTGTLRGNQLAFAAGTETVRIVRRDDVLGNMRARADQAAARLAVLAEHPGVREVRGMGLMWGIELAVPALGHPNGGTPGELAELVQATALRAGLIVELGGREDCVVRMLPPLNVTAEIMDLACEILINAITRVV